MNKFLLLILSLVLLNGCRTAQQKVSLSSSKYPSEFRNECIRLYPVKTKDSLVIRTVHVRDTIPGKTIFVDCDSVVKHAEKQKPFSFEARKHLTTVPVTCPPTVYLLDSIISLQSTVVEDQRKVEMWRETSDELQQTVTELQTLGEVKDRTIFRLSILGTVTSLLVLLLLYFYLKR